jgi:hypothetical protein
MSRGLLRFGAIVPIVASVPALCLGYAWAAAVTREALVVGMNLWAAAGLMIIASLAALTLAEVAATTVRSARNSLRMTVRARAPAYPS